MHSVLPNLSSSMLHIVLFQIANAATHVKQHTYHASSQLPWLGAMEKPQLHVLGLKLSSHCLAIRRKGHVTGLATSGKKGMHG